MYISTIARLVVAGPEQRLETSLSVGLLLPLFGHLPCQGMRDGNILSPSHAKTIVIISWDTASGKACIQLVVPFQHEDWGCQSESDHVTGSCVRCFSFPTFLCHCPTCSTLNRVLQPGTAGKGSRRQVHGPSFSIQSDMMNIQDKWALCVKAKMQVLSTRFYCSSNN
jgi:hypothetical protein